MFYAALEVTDPAQRRQFLDEACAGDVELRAAVEELLSTQAEADQLFTEGSSSLAELANELKSADSLDAERNEPTFEEKPGTIIGRYKLVQKIGEGGCGVVYMAEQKEPVRRRVALKVIKLGMDTKNVIARFEVERQALAMMDHPNIARVLDAGATDAGRPYFVMELVNGMKITEYCDQNQLGLGQRLELFIQICHAIQHAHQKGIIHRDIKPSNILVTLHDGVPVPKVIDFGIAKATGEQLTDKTLFTAYAQLIGTPAYMSPEQMNLNGLDLDTRSDIYSLGVLLYELLTGRTPFDTKELLKSGVYEMRRTLREREPTTPSAKLRTLNGEELTKMAMQRHVEPPQLLSQLRGDLDWIIMKALEKDRKRRYETANGLAMDIQRYLVNEPVIARPPSNWYRLQKLVRRNRIVFIAGAAVGAALLIGTVTSTWLLVKERAARARETALLLESEAREKTIQASTQGSVLAALQKYQDADKLFSSISLDTPSKESAAMLRALGAWHAVNGRWRQAVERFAPLVKVDQHDNWGLVAFDYLQLGLALIESGDLSGYEQMRQKVVARFAGVTDPIADRVLKGNLLLPANEQMMRDLNPHANITLATFDAVKKDDLLKAAWHAVTLGLWEYRRGNYSEATNWCLRCLDFHEANAVLTATAHLILAMSCQQMNQSQKALSELSLSQPMIEMHFNQEPDFGNGSDGFWFDWVFARILLRECQQQIADADNAMAQVSMLQTNQEFAAQFRALGDWHAINGRWPQAAERFATLVNVDQLDSWDTVSMDFLKLGPALIESGDTNGYERFRQTILTRLGNETNSGTERIIKISLLLPANRELIQTLVPQAEIFQKLYAGARDGTGQNAGTAVWRAVSLALFEYRRGNYAEAASWCRFCLAYPNHSAARDAAAHVILAMSCWRMNQPQSAQSELSQGREMIETKFKSGLDQGNAAQGFWFDWDFARILLREAAGQLATAPNQTNSPAQ